MKPLFKCPNPIKEFKLGKFVFMYQWAEEIWEKDVDGFRETYYVKVNKVDNGQNKALNLLVWKLSVYIFKEN